MTVFAVVTGGGTSGHVVPAVAILESLVDSGVPVDQLAYVGSRRGAERTVVPPLGFRCEFLPISGLQRSVSPRALALNIALPFRLLRSTLRARALLRSWKPAVVVSVGGYASEPMARAAASAGTPVVCVSYDRSPGLATRRQARTATACAVAFEGSALPNAVVTGAPVRSAVRRMDSAAVRADVRREMGLDEGTSLVTVVGGSLGSAVLNDAVADIAAALDGAGLRAVIHHVTGPRFFVAPDRRRTGSVEARLVAHDPELPRMLAASDVVVSRAGASTVAEIAALGAVGVLVPWPGAADDHQTANARWLSDAGAAVLVAESATTGPDVASEVVRLCSDDVARSAISSRAREMGARNRSGALVEVIRNAATC
ncbi:MAG: UDP-N-acetylglucosamine--N-acetylmuramyl-(pentapeptide) pyrophosphoryl-undecaprenol N-acetylglucosamine transferase [Ilumatobacteraceae bacterium]